MIAVADGQWRTLSRRDDQIVLPFEKKGERKGYHALSDGLTALASGEGRLALAKAARAEKYLQKPELTDLGPAFSAPG